ncbi:hypothetical protein phytr_1390 [Candidatus Phycorickettsia trachydisci]|uniref:Uncharacterized protein n=1 Tax=Candidatus Phycorickettsia trachydisci TaxID=2115978 RepID=A0A2P1P759_9RICK|nr:DUF2628 domain-containing protein [Candidatus Phycorickettsia trachydisci]AVP87098.1 hypothetical protein phytr_1390 [Candidatus Phycorickettsia trachydisci]
MKIFAIYCSKFDKNHIIPIQEGFSFSALIFGIFWAIYYRIWTAVIVTFLIAVICTFFTSQLGGTACFFLNNLMMLVYGFFGQDMLAYKLSNQYYFADIVLAYNEEEAEVKYRNYQYHRYV